MTDARGAIRAFILAEFLPGESESNLHDDTPLHSSGVLDSLATLRLVAFLEDRFAIEIAPHEATAENLESVDTMAALVESRQRSD